MKIYITKTNLYKTSSTLIPTKTVMQEGWYNVENELCINDRYLLSCNDTWIGWVDKSACIDFKK